MLAYISRCFTQIIFGAKKQVCFLSLKDCCGVGDCLNCCRIGWKHYNGGMNRLGGGELLNFVGLEDLVADIRTLEYISNSYALAEGLHCEVSPGEVRCI